MKPFLAALLALVFLPLMAAGEKADENDWMTFYYKNPTPDQLVVNVRSWSKSGMLKDQNAQPPMVAFVSRVMAANPGRIAGWLDELKDLTEPEREMLLGAAWYSDTDEARAYFQKHKHEEYLKEKAPKILEQEVKDPTALDMLWGWFMATGDKEPIRRLISALRLSDHLGALDRYKASSKKTEKEKEEAYLEVTFQAAQWSLESNCKQHPLVLKHCDAIFPDPQLSEDERLWLGVLLSKVKPDKYSVETGKGKVEVRVKKDGEA